MRVPSLSGDVEGEGFPRRLPSAPRPSPSPPPPGEGARGGAPECGRAGLGAGFYKIITAWRARRAVQRGATARPGAGRAEPLSGRARPSAILGAARCSGRPGRAGYPRRPAAGPWRGAAPPGGADLPIFPCVAGCPLLPPPPRTHTHTFFFPRPYN